MFVLKKMTPLLFLFCLSVIISFSNVWAGLEVIIFDCGQGNTVAAKHNNKTILFDAGRKGSSKFAAYYEDNKCNEIILKRKYSIKEQNPPVASQKLFVLSQLYVLEAISGNNKAYKTQFNKSLKKYLLKDGRTLSAVFISHPDADHYNLVVDAALNPNVFVLGGSFPLYSSKFRNYLDDKICIKDDEYGTDNPLPRYLAHANFAQYCSFGTEADDPTVKILSVNAGKTGAVSDKNTDSMVIKLSQKHSMIIPGDAEKKTWEDAEQIGGADGLKADVLLLSHHGSKTNDSTTPDLLNKIQPKVCLISAGFQHNHPTKEIIDMLFGYYNGKSYRTLPHFLTFQQGTARRCVITDAPIFTTIDNGALTVDLSSDILTVTCARDFNPTPDVSLFDGEGTRLFFDTEGRKTFLSQEDLQKIDAEAFNDTPFGPSIYGVKIEGDDNEKYYYKFGDAYLKMALLEEKYKSEDEESNDDSSTITRVPNIAGWVTAHQATGSAYVDRVQLEEVRRELPQ